MTALTLWEMYLRLLAAFLAGALVGWERESHGRPAGLRTTILACIASAVAMIISEALFIQSAATSPTGSWRPDPARLGAGILTGIGFLGAGAIIRHADSIRGVTTAATLWFVTVLGLAFGSGEFGIGAAGVVLALITLYVLPAFEKHIPSEWYAKLSVTFKATAFKVDQLKARIEATGLVIKSMHLSFDVERQCRTVICEVKVKRSRVHPLSTQLVEDLAGSDGVMRVRWF